MKRFSIHIFCLLFYASSFAQINLVPNWSFEDTVNCPTGGSQLYNALGWLNPSLGTPDYMNACNTGIVNVPNSISGFQYAKTGNAYAGIFAYALGSGREYIEIKLIDSLKKGKKYCVSFYLSTASPDGVGINKMGAYFSNTFVSSGSTATLPFAPQFESSSSTFFADTVNWMKVEGDFIANGGENYITIGSFNDDVFVDTIHIKPFAGAFVYYYIDDVSLVECDELIIPNVFSPNNDGTNDFFEIKYLPTNAITQIFNRWGIKVFETSKSDIFWDGRTTSGIESVDGTYFYLITTEEKTYKGFVQLIK